MMADPDVPPGAMPSRVRRSKAQARASYNRLSRWYDLLAGSERRLIDRGIDSLGVQAGETVLEIGCGTGYALLALARSVGATGRVYGLDIAEGMLRIARTRVGAMRVAVGCGDGAYLPFVGGLFDAVWMSFTLELFDTPEIPVVLGECRRVLRSGGRLGVVAMSRRGSGWPLRLYEWTHELLPSLVDCRPIFCREALTVAGFAVSVAEDLRFWGLPVEIVVGRKP